MRSSWLGVCCLALVAASACSDAVEAQRVERLVVTDGEGLTPITTDLGYEVELSSGLVVAKDLQFAIAGEAHASWLEWVSDAIVPQAHAHPGHFQAGEITGELSGHFLLHFVAGEEHEVGTATLLVGKYQSANLTFTRAGEGDVEQGHPLLGHTALLSGSATRDGNTIEFTISIDSPLDRQLIGIPFAVDVTESGQGPLALRLLTRDPLENDTLFDGIDFAQLDFDADGRVDIEQASPEAASAAACNTVRRVLQTHDHFRVQPQ